jgi:hypothetical protein
MARKLAPGRTGANGFSMKPKRGRLGLGLGVALLVLLLDQAVKLYIVNAVMTPPRVIPVTSFLDLVMVWNRGVSFGLFGDGGVGPYLLAGLAVAIAAILVAWLRKAETGLLGLGLGLGFRLDLAALHPASTVQSLAGLQCRGRGDQHRRDPGPGRWLVPAGENA